MTKETERTLLDLVADSYIAKGGRYAEIGRNVKDMVQAEIDGRTPAKSRNDIARDVAAMMGIMPGNQNTARAEVDENVILPIREIIDIL